ncbi:tetratricopeptide repeat protein [bacterium]|nr:tetratricopeptide repeat protein [bacterium]
MDSLLQAGVPTAAVAEARRLSARVGDDPVYGWQVTGRLGLALLASGEAAAALPHLEDIVRHLPRDAVHHRNLGAALLQLDRRGRALSEYQVAVELDPADPELRREYGQMLLAFRDLRRAGRELHTARELCGGCPATDEPLASYHLLAGEPAAAVPYLQRIQARNPSPEHRRTLLAALVAAGQDSAVVALIGTGEAERRPADEWRLLVEAEGRLADLPTTREVAAGLAANPERVPRAVAGDDRFWGTVALNLIGAAAWDDALRAVDRAIALAPDAVVHRNNRVVVLTALGRHDEARAEWERVRRLDPTRAENPPPPKENP